MQQFGSKAKIKDEYSQGMPGHVLEARYFYFDTAPDDNSDLAIVCGGYEKCASDYEINRNNYPYYFIKYTLKGKGTLSLGENVYELRPGMLSGFSQGTPHQYRADSKDPMEHAFVTFTGALAKEYFDRSGLAEKGVISGAGAEIQKIIQRILDKGFGKPPFAQEICCDYLKILLLELGGSVLDSGSPQSISLQTYSKCRKFIDENFSQLLMPGDVADACSVNIRYMSSLFKRFGDCTPSQYITRLKMNKAGNMLLATSQSVKEIAMAVGFTDQYHFSRKFKEFQGCSPIEFRRKHLGQES